MFKKLKESQLSTSTESANSSSNKTRNFATNRPTLRTVSPTDLDSPPLSFDFPYDFDLPSERRDDEANVFSILDQISDQANRQTNEDTDNDSVQILDECGGRESVRVLGANTDSDSTGDEFVPFQDDDEIKTNSQEMDNTSIILLNSSNDGSTNHSDLLNNDFGANDADAMSMLVNLSQDRSPLSSPGKIFLSFILF